MKAIIAGGGVGGLTTALMLHARGMDCDVFEQSEQIRELGVGINTLPHAIKELAALGLLQRLDAVAIRTYELFYTNRFGQEIWREQRGLDAGYDVPQFSIHRGRLQGVIHEAVRERLGDEHVHTGHRLGAFRQDEAGVTAYFFDRTGAHRATAHGDILVGADGIHSAVREALYPDEGPARWNGAMLWRGDAAHPMYPVGSNGASQAILDARALADHLVAAEHPMQALWAYDRDRLPPTAQIVQMNRSGGPEGVIDAVEERAPNGFTDIDAVLSYEERKAIVRGYAATAGFAREQVNAPPTAAAGGR